MAGSGRGESLRNAIESFQERSIGLATGKKVDYKQWESSREELLSQQELSRTVPKWVFACRSGSQYWQFIKKQSPTWAGRREFIWETLSPVFELVEKGPTQPAATSIERILKTCTSETVEEAWARVLARREVDPEGAITAARSLLETTCKHVLDKLKVRYEDKDDLPQLYGKAAGAMKLGPQDHKEQVFKQILSGCISVVTGLAALRNTLGDAHGKGAKQPKPTSRHADLAVNLSGTLSVFLISTYEERFKGNGETGAA